MHLLHFLAACAAISSTSAFLVPPPTGSTAAPETIAACSGWHVVVAGDTCASVTSSAGITLALFEAMVRFCC